MTRRRRIVVTRTGGPEVLRVDSDDAPEPGPRHLRIRVTAAGVARADLLMRAGRYPGRAPTPPFTPGWDVTGVVDQVGPHVPTWWRGRRVVALTLTGGHASHVCVPAAGVVEVPDTVQANDAACLPLTHVTANELLHHVARVRPGERVLVHGAAGGVGIALLEIGRLLGAHMYGVAAPRDHAFVETYGGRPVERGREAATRADVVLDMIGGPTLRASWRSLRPGGRLVSYGFLSTQASPPADVLRLRLWNALPNGRRAAFYRLSTNARRRPRRIRATLERLVVQLGEGRLHPRIAACVPLDDPAEAHRIADDPTARGKVLLVP
ncbi:oxidoreductase [Streptomyces spinoverrucosus]|uniref:Oxidoreductase n=1 Tax=Streptomyces spinoverrucosus TaxID=284043 RepID=A0A4Y3VNV2_9ACTN|nr:zinc-binding dehydrogenase [Streptomyces spinoverrucosus]GEC06716.1 oxidoreductase [Streptomyces spinoverrucosus]GHB56578.1 oxidoreductase [Streptomyces spinoverrucosus]